MSLSLFVWVAAWTESATTLWDWGTRRITPYSTGVSKKTQVTDMFDTISGEYDAVNRLITAGIDLHWRANLIRSARKKKPRDVLDVATGTGDLALSMARKLPTASRIVGLDISPGMLSVGRKKAVRMGLSDRVEFVQGDGERLPFARETFDLVTVAFGVRNFEHLGNGLKEIYRVIRPAGHFFVLETSVPSVWPLRPLYKFYTMGVMPRVANLFSRDKHAYKYLARSANHFPHGTAFTQILGQIGFCNSTHKPQTLGAAAVYEATRPNRGLSWAW